MIKLPGSIAGVHIPEQVEVAFEDLQKVVMGHPQIILGAVSSLLHAFGAGLEGGAEVQPISLGALPLDAPITKMIPPAQAGLLSDAAKRLTKQDLMALGGWGVPIKTPTELGLSLDDIQKVRDVFTPKMLATESSDAAGFSLSCCSCTPCCCAATEQQPIRPLA